MRRDGRTPPSPAAGEGRARKTHKPRKASGECPLRQRRPRARKAPRSGRVPHPSPSTHRLRAEGERRGARGQSEKSGPIRQGMSVPRLARLRPGPGERDVTTSIGSGGASRKARAGKAGRGTGQRGGGPGPHRSRRRETRRGQPGSHTERACALQKPRHVSPLSLFPTGFLFPRARERKEEHGPRGPGPEARGSQQPAPRRPAGRTAFARAKPGHGEGKESLRFAAREAPGETPNLPVVQSPEDSVSTLISWYKMPTSG